MGEKRLTKIVHGCVVGSHSKLSIPELAAQLGVAPSTLYARLNPYDETNNLPLEHAHDLMLAAQSVELIRVMAADFGMRLVPVDAAPDGSDMQDEICQGFQAVNAFIQAVNKNTVSDVEIFNLREKAAIELDQVQQRFLSERRNPKRSAA